MRPALCEDALRLGRILAELAPDEPEVHGLVALMEIQASRRRARRADGRADPAARSGPRALGPAAHPPRPRRAGARRGAGRRAAGPYALQAAIAACHARARTPEETDWARIAALYDALAQLTPSPVVELNRAVAVAMAFGPAAGPRARRRADVRAGAQDLSPAAERARRSARQARPRRRGASNSSAPRRSRATPASAFTALPRLAAAQDAPVSQAFRDQAASASKHLQAAAELMPEAKYSFKPTPAQMSLRRHRRAPRGGERLSLRRDRRGEGANAREGDGREQQGRSDEGAQGDVRVL